MGKLYEGLKVLDLSERRPGPATASFFGDYGAEVIHVEKPGENALRQAGPMLDGQSLSFCVENRGHKSVVLDIETEKGREAVLRLAKDADIVIHTSDRKRMQALGLNYRAIKAVNPKVIYCAITPWGQTGPYANRMDYGLVGQAATTAAFRTGEPKGPPLLVNNGDLDDLGALIAFNGINMALVWRQNTGRGQLVDISTVRITAWMFFFLDYTYVAKRVMARRAGNSMQNLAPYGIYEGNNGEGCVIAALNDKLWTNLCTTMGRPDMLEDPKYKSNMARLVNTDVLRADIEQWLKTFDSIDTPVQMLDAAGVPVAKCATSRDVDENEHCNSQGWITEYPVMEGMTTTATRRFPSDPFNFSKCQPEYKRAPGLGEHTFEVLEKAGYTAEEIRAMEAEWKA